MLLEAKAGLVKYFLVLLYCVCILIGNSYVFTPLKYLERNANFGYGRLCQELQSTYAIWYMYRIPFTLSEIHYDSQTFESDMDVILLAFFIQKNHVYMLVNT